MKRLSELVFTPTASKLFRTSCVKELPDWFFDAPYGDFSVVLVCSKYGYVYYHDECMSAYRTNVPGSAMGEPRGRNEEIPELAFQRH